MTFTSTSVDLDGPIVAYAWDLDGDGGVRRQRPRSRPRSRSAPGFHRVGLRVVDRDGAAASVYRPIVIASLAPELLRPFPVVRLSVRHRRTRACACSCSASAGRPGVRVRVRCRGRDCPWRRRSVVADDGSVRFRRLQRRLRAGTVIEVFATRPGHDRQVHALPDPARARARARGRLLRRRARGAPEPPAPASRATFTTSLPTFAPSNSMLMAVGSCSKPSTTVSSGLQPAVGHAGPPISADRLGRAVEVVEHDEALEQRRG